MKTRISLTFGEFKSDFGGFFTNFIASFTNFSEEVGQKDFFKNPPQVIN